MREIAKSSILLELAKAYPKVALKQAKQFYWSPKESTIYYNPSQLDADKGRWALLHEAAHAHLGHNRYSTDLELLIYEVKAWQKAKNLGKKMGISIDQEHIESCLDTYRDWLYARSTCPTCELNGLQNENDRYTCLNCLTSWDVSPSRFCRPYRMQNRSTASENKQINFA